MTDWTEVEERIGADDRIKWDRTATAPALHVVEDGALEVNGDGHPERYVLSELAASQMCQRLSIPVPYYRRLPHELQAAVANHDLKRLNGNAFLLRGRHNWLRAFLSTDYVAYNNRDIVDTVKELLKGANVTVKSFVLEETHLFIKIVSEDIVDRDSGLKAGVMVGNSEVGMGSITAEPFVFRLACTNDLVMSEGQSFRHPHTRLSLDELRKGTALAISIAFDVASGVLERFLKTRQEPIADPVETIRQLAESRKLSRKFADDVVSSYVMEPEPTRFGVINAFTRAAQRLGPLQRIEVERFAGTLIAARA